MKLTKFGHCCLLIEEGGVRILTDPGSFSTLQNEVQDLDVILITHEHSDHFHIESIKKILEHNTPLIITNSAVAKLLEEAGIPNAQIVEDGKIFEYKSITFKGFGKEHAQIYESYGLVMNTGYLIADRFYYPGDSYFVPGVSVDILAFPVGGPWLKISDTIDFVLQVNPKNALPVHDGMFNDIGISLSRGLAQKKFEEAGIKFVNIQINEVVEF